MPRKTEPTYITERGIFPTNLRELMKERGVNQKKLAEVIEMRPQTVSLYVTGQSVPDINCLQKIAAFFNVSADWLIGCPNSPKTIDSDIAAAMKYTGLSESAINWLHLADPKQLKILDLLLRNYDFRRSVGDIADLQLLINRAGDSFQNVVTELDSDEIGQLGEKIISQYSELAKQTGGLHVVDDYEYFHMREYKIDKKLSEIVESILYCETDEIIKDMKDLVFDDISDY